MKLTLKMITMMLALAAIVGCGETGEQFVIREAGLWDVVSETTKQYQDSILVSNITRTDSLGQMQFNMTGQGFRLLPAKTDTFVWQLNADDDRLIVYYKVGPFMNAAILNQTETSMDLEWEYESAVGTTDYKTEHSATIERAQ